jgi:hypothetical protein
MSADDRTVFISYRRGASWASAQLIRNELCSHGFDVFMDVADVNSGRFRARVLAEIEARYHFIVLLDQQSLVRTARSNDWLRCEIAHALAHSRNIVPIMLDGFELNDESELPPDISTISAYNQLPVAHDYFDAAMERLRNRFLRGPTTYDPRRWRRGPVKNTLSKIRDRLAMRTTAR